MDPLLELVPNISVGRDARIVDRIVDAARSAAAAAGSGSAHIADVHRDEDHDRTVVTIVGCGAALRAAGAALARATVELVDLRHADGVHPRIGALDVLPVVSLEADARRDEGRAAAHALADDLGRLLGCDLAVPVIRYGVDEDGQPVTGAETTGAVRRGGPERVTERIEAGDLEVRFGPSRPHVSAGRTMVGVRDILVAFNVDLACEDPAVARGIAARIRGSAMVEGAVPLTGVRALGMLLASRGCAQVSTNIDSYRRCGPARVLEVVARLAQQDGHEVARAELVGLAPDAALGPLRYACARLGVPLQAGPAPSLDAAMVAARRYCASPPAS